MEILQIDFRDGRLPTECTWQKVVLITKSNGEFRGIVIVEVLWKSLLGLINWKIVTALKFHDVLNGFWTGRGTGTNSLEAKLLQELMEIREEVLY